MQQQLKRKEQECEKLKEAIDGLLKIQYQLADSCNKYVQTLAEIKDICSEMNCESLMQNSWCGNTDFKMGCCEKVLKRQLLQVINESEVDNGKRNKR